MIRNGIIHAELARHLVALRHTDTFVICDSGLPLAAETPCVDLGYRYGQPRFADVVAAVLPELAIETSWISRQMIEVNQNCLASLKVHGLDPDPLEHDDFKQRVRTAKFAVRTGEATYFANVLCRAGVAF